MRYPAVAGAFYERSRDALLRQIKECYTHPLGPGRVPQLTAGPRRLVGLVVPHAGYVYSGPVAAHSYSALAADGWPASFVVLGPNHHGQGAPLALTDHDWQTPLGVAAIDKDLHDSLAKPPLEEDIVAHRDEHSIEVQLPFLQQLADAVRFVPICMAFQEYELAAEVGELVAETVKGKDVLLIASSDFTHVGSQYFQLAPQGVTAPAFAKGQDAREGDRADPRPRSEAVRGEGRAGRHFDVRIRARHRHVDGREAATSSDVSRDTKMAVGYGAVAVYR
ncbi:MAG: AmmeMemoRadiSam system protein B [Methanobacteriota archaeon]|nr:MAG: AmmeMemoRadiSam system protein B [Euryarchaeota archaeon]